MNKANILSSSVIPDSEPATRTVGNEPPSLYDLQRQLPARTQTYCQVTS
jgi:hypothetical protein